MIARGILVGIYHAGTKAGGLEILVLVSLKTGIFQSLNGTGIPKVQ
jgi:hypothetical protein